MSRTRVRGALEGIRGDLPVALLAALAGIGGSYAVSGWSDRFLLVPIDQRIVTATPGRIVSWTIVTLGETGHLLHYGLATALALALLGGVAVLGRVVARRGRDHLAGVAVAAAGAAAVTYAITGALLSSLAAALPLALVLSAAAAAVDPAPVSRSRRNVLALTGAVVGFLGLSYRAGRDAAPLADVEPLPDEAAHETMIADARANEFAVEELDGLVTPIRNFYTVDVASSPPRIDPDDWTLRIAGAVENEVSIDYEELRERDPERRFVTLRCVSDSRNGGYIDTALWTGVPVADLVEQAAPESGCECVMLRAADGYYERFPLEALRRTFLAYGMNGRTLPARHGAPVRALVPGHWGEINVKWLTEIEVLEEEAEGFWEQRGWHGTGPVKTVAKLSAENRLEDGRIEVAGHAYAGTRGVSSVQVSTDGAETWAEAELSDPLPGDDVWRQWRYAFEPSGEHEVVVRAVEDDGTVQPDEETDSFPDGPSGWVRTTVG